MKQKTKSVLITVKRKGQRKPVVTLGVHDKRNFYSTYGASAYDFRV